MNNPCDGLSSCRAPSRHSVLYEMVSNPSRADILIRCQHPHAQGAKVLGGEQQCSSCTAPHDKWSHVHVRHVLPPRSVFSAPQPTDLLPVDLPGREPAWLCLPWQTWTTWQINILSSLSLLV